MHLRLNLREKKDDKKYHNLQHQHVGGYVFVRPQALRRDVNKGETVWEPGQWRCAHAWRRGRGRAARAQGGRPAGQSARALAMARWLQALAVVLLLAAAASARKSPAPSKHEPQIEEVTAKQLERVLEDKDFVAVYWCKWPLARCSPTGARLRLILRAFESWPTARAGAVVVVSKRLRRRPSKWVIVELMIFGRA